MEDLEASIPNLTRSSLFTMALSTGNRCSCLDTKLTTSSARSESNSPSSSSICPTPSYIRTTRAALKVVVRVRAKSRGTETKGMVLSPAHPLSAFHTNKVRAVPNKDFPLYISCGHSTLSTLLRVDTRESRLGSEILWKQY